MLSGLCDKKENMHLTKEEGNNGMEARQNAKYHMRTSYLQQRDADAEKIDRVETKKGKWETEAHLTVAISR